MSVPALLAVPPADIGRTVLFATHSIQIDRDCIVKSGDLVVNAAGVAPFLGEAALALDQGVTTAAGYALRANSIDIDSGATVGGDAVFNTLVNGGVISGAQVSPLSLPVIASVPAMTAPGTDPSLGNITVPKNGLRTIDPGVYGTLSVGDGAVVTFSGGAYTFASISSGRGAQLLADASVIVVTGRVNLGTETSFGATTRAGAPDSVLHVHGINGVDGTLQATPKAVVIGRACIISANILALNGTISFDRDLNAEGSFLARDIQVGRTSRVTLNSTFANEPPVADPQSVFTAGAAPLDILLTGSDPEGEALTFSIVTGPTQGTLSPLSGSTVTYTPFTSGGVFDSFTFSVTDPHGASATALVTINPSISDPTPTDGSVTVVDASGQVIQDQFVTWRIFGTAPAATSLTFTITRQPSHGTIVDLLQEASVPQRGAQVTYLPATGFTGDDSFAFQACGDVNGDMVCATGTFTIHVIPGENNGR